MDYNEISIQPYVKSHLELIREITLTELAPSPYFYVQSICLAYMNMFTRFDENPAMTLQDTKVTKHYRRTHGRTDGQRENSIPTTNKVCGGYNKFTIPGTCCRDYLNRFALKGHIMAKCPVDQMLNKVF